MAQPSTIQSGNKINDTAPQVKQNYSTFPLSYCNKQSHQYAYINPHCNFETQEGFSDSLRCMAETFSLSLNAPLKSDIYQKRSNFYVPMQAILPKNWEQINVQPTQGDDVADNVNGAVAGSVLDDLFYRLSLFIRRQSLSSQIENPIAAYLTGLIKALIVGECFCSQGSLAKKLRYSWCQYLFAQEYDPIDPTIVRNRSFDYFADHVLTALAPRSSSDAGIYHFTVNWVDEDDAVTDTYYVYPVGDLALRDNERISFRHFLDLARQNLNFYISEVSLDDNWDMVLVEEEEEEDHYSLSDEFCSAVFGNMYYDGAIQFASIRGNSQYKSEYNFNYLSAYQIICAHFFSNDTIDYIYSAQLYRNLMEYYMRKLFSNSVPTFSWNGLTFEYDALSGYVIDKCFTLITSALTTSVFQGSSHKFYFDYLTSLMSHRHNLKYADYFTGGRTRPLSVGNVGVAVADSSVNVVDIIKQKNYARFLNWSMRIGKKFADYIKGKANVEVRPDLHDPQWLSGTGDLVFAKDVQNTGALQAEAAQSKTANLYGNSNRYQFTYTADRLGYVICVTTYDIPRCYPLATGRDIFHCNRYDIFNPFMQYDGSQEVSKAELGTGGDTPFSYQGRNMEYKQMYDICSGMWVERLPGFTFLADSQIGVPMQSNLNPTYIRSWNSELDGFYLSLTGYVLGYYAHFQVINTNVITAKRNMEYQPQLM